jgi:hypothetical protein
MKDEAIGRGYAGGAMPGRQMCARCGAAIEPVSTLCPQCGTPFGRLEEERTDDVTSVANAPPPSSGSNSAITGEHKGFPEPITDGAGSSMPSTGIVLARPQPLVPMPHRKDKGRSAQGGPEPVTQIEDTMMSQKNVTTDPTQSGPMAVLSVANAETSLIKGRLAIPLLGHEPQTAPSLPAVRPSQTTPDEAPFPWLNPWVMAVGAMLLLSLGLLIGLLLT